MEKAQSLRRSEQYLDFANADRTKRAVLRCMRRQGITREKITEFFGCSNRCYNRISYNARYDDLREDWEHAEQWNGEIKVVRWYGRDDGYYSDAESGGGVATVAEEGRGGPGDSTHPDDESDIEDDLDCTLRRRRIRRLANGEWPDIPPTDSSESSSEGSEYNPNDEDSLSEESADSDSRSARRRRTSSRMRRDAAPCGFNPAVLTLTVTIRRH